MSTFFELDKICKKYDKSDVFVVNNFSLKIDQGQLIALTGRSGSGKSTILHVSGLLDDATSGNITFEDVICDKLSDKDKTKIRRDYFGFIYQFHHLLNDFSVLENVMIPQIIAKKDKKHAENVAVTILERVGLKDKVNRMPTELSGGEKQRVAIARALSNSPKILFADEPTGNLDDDTATEVFDLMKELAIENKMSILMATHNVKLVSEFNQVIKL